MDISKFYELRERLYNTAAAGCMTVSEDFRLKRAVDDFKQLGENVCGVLRIARIPHKGAVLGELFYNANERRIYLCPLSVVSADGATRLV